MSDAKIPPPSPKTGGATRETSPGPAKPKPKGSVAEATGRSTAEKAGAQGQRVNIGNAGKRDHNL